MQRVISHNHPRYRKRLEEIGDGRYNGAFYYSQEICRFMIPTIKTDRNWITVNIPGVGTDHAIVFVHNNLHPEHYDHLAKYKDLILVCGIEETTIKVARLGTPILLPLSVDLEEVRRYAREKTKGVAFVGRGAKRNGIDLPRGIDYIEGLPRTELLQTMAQYQAVYAVGRTAIEAKALGCEVLPYDPRYPDPGLWEVLDSRKAAEILQEKLSAIDHQAKAHNSKTKTW